MVPRENTVMVSRAVASWNVPIVSDLDALDVAQADHLYNVINADKLDLTTGEAFQEYRDFADARIKLAGYIYTLAQAAD